MIITRIHICLRFCSNEMGLFLQNRRNKIYNYFSVMVRKRLKADDDHDEDGEKLPSGKSTKKKKGCK